MNSKRWQDHFEDAARAAELTVPEASGLNPLISILEQRIISEEAYLAWAQEAFELPILKNSFFADHSGDSTFWNKWQSQYAWQVDCLPICEWDGTLYVACLEPKEFAPEMNAVCLLTSLGCLQTRWAEYHATPIQSENLDSADLVVEQLPSEDEVVVEMSSENEEIVETSETSQPVVAAAPAEEFQLEDTPETSEAPASEEMPSGMEAPEGIVALNTPSAAKEDSISFDSLNLETTPEQTEAPSEAVASADLAPAGLENATAASVEKKATPKTVEVVRSDVGTVKPASILKKTAPLTGSVFFFENVLKKTPCPVDANATFEAMKTHFAKSMLFAVDTTERAAKPVAWDASFSAPEVMNEITLTSPSIFRIACSTQRPYHGAITQNDVNDQFFAEWNKSQIPDHVTVVPLIVQEHVVGFLMGFAGTEAFNRASLQHVETLATELAFKLDFAAKQAA